VISLLGTNVIDKRDILLGSGKLYINNISVGQLKGDVAFTPTADYKEFKAGVPQQTVKLLKFSEGAELKASFAEMNAANFARATNVEQSAIVTVTDDVTAESVVLSGTDTVQLAKGRHITSLVIVKGATPCVLNTDYELVSAATGQIRRVPGSLVIASGDTVSCAYTYRESDAVSFGGGAQPADAPAKFVYDSPDGDVRITIEFPLAKIKTGNAITFKEEDFSTSDFTVVAVSDSSKAAGAQLGTITIEYFPT